MARKKREQRVLITGAATGIGFQTARRFARGQGDLVLTDIDSDGLKAALEQLNGSRARLHSYTVDVSDHEQVMDLARQVEESLGGLDVLINNAGIGYQGDLADTSLETWQRLMNVNFWGLLFHVQAFLPMMKRQKSGQIVNISSGQVFFRLPTWGAYTVSKLAVAGFSEVLHFELRRYGIKVTTVYPYLVNTGFYDGVEGETLGARLSMKLLPYYSHSPEHVARLIFRAVSKQKREETTSSINDVARWMHVFPPVRNLVGLLAAYALSGREH